MDVVERAHLGLHSPKELTGLLTMAYTGRRLPLLRNSSSAFAMSYSLVEVIVPARARLSRFPARDRFVPVMSTPPWTPPWPLSAGGHLTVDGERDSRSCACATAFQAGRGRGIAQPWPAAVP